jgi:hypothetical protein
MALYRHFGFIKQEPLSSQELAEHKTMRQRRLEFWQHSFQSNRDQNNAVKRLVCLVFLLFFVTGAEMNGEWLAVHIDALWGVLIGSLLQIPVIYLSFRGRRGA